RGTAGRAAARRWHRGCSSGHPMRARAGRIGDLGLALPAAAGMAGAAGPAPAGAASGGAAAVQHGAQPNPGEVRPGSPQGDAPSETAGALSRPEQARRVLGLPVTAALVITA